MPSVKQIGSKLRGLDSTLLAMYPKLSSIAIDENVSVKQWFNFRKSNGISSSILLNLISDTFDIPTITSKNCNSGTYVYNGFYCSERDLLFTSSVLNEHFTEINKLGFFIDNVFSNREQCDLTSACVNLRRDAIQNEWHEKGVISVKFRKGLAFSSYFSREVFLESMPSELTYWESPGFESSYKSEYLINTVWKKSIETAIDRIENGNSQKLFVISGDGALDAIPLFYSIMKANGKYSCLNASIKDEFADIFIMTESMLHDQKITAKVSEILSTGSAYVVFFSAAKTIIELFPKLSSFLTLRQILMQLASHDIRVGMPMLCTECATKGKKVSPSHMLLEFDLESREYLVQGDGCDNCVDGINAVHILSESSFKDQDVYKSFAEAKNNKDLRLEPFIIHKEFGKSGVSNIYTSLGSALTHGIVQLKDAQGVLI